MNTIFDKVIDRRDTYSMKYDFAGRGKPDDVIPLWVADMDFASPPCVIEALEQQLRHGIFGYFNLGDKYAEIVQSWFARNYDWQLNKRWLITTPGVVNAIHVAVMAFTEPGESVLIQQPAYYPFMLACEKTDRKLVVNELAYKDGAYKIDFDDFERKIAENSVKAFILCNPHNPVGRVWTRDELTHMGDICLKHGVIVISDEIHQDFVYDGYRHLVFANLGEKYRDITIICTSPTKTFNLPGLPLGNVFIANKKMRERFSREYAKFGVTQIGVMEVLACEAAYTQGEPWLLGLQKYLAGNMALIGDFLKEKLPRIKLIKPEATYLAWIDFRALSLSDSDLDALVTNKARLWLHRGVTFGAGGEGFMRLNAACPRSVLLEALERLDGALR